MKSYLQSDSYNQVHIDQQMQGAGKSASVGNCFWMMPLQFLYLLS